MAAHVHIRACMCVPAPVQRPALCACILCARVLFCSQACCWGRAGLCLCLSFPGRKVLGWDLPWLASHCVGSLCRTPGRGFVTPAVGLVKELYNEYLAWVWPRLWEWTEEQLGQGKGAGQA